MLNLFVESSGCLEIKKNIEREVKNNFINQVRMKKLTNWRQIIIE